MPDRPAPRRHRPDQAAAVWLDDAYTRKADEIAARLTLRGTLGSRVTRVQAVRVALDELHDHLTEQADQADQASTALPAG